MFRDLWDEEVTAKLVCLNREFKERNLAIDQNRKTIAAEPLSEWAAILKTRNQNHWAKLFTVNAETAILLQIREGRKS